MARRPTADFRGRLVAAIDAGLPPREAAQRFCVGRRAISRWLARRRRGERLADRPRPGRPPQLAPGQHPAVRDLVAAPPDATLPELGRQPAAARGVRLSPSRLSRLLARLGPPLKQNR
jgi:transposase